MAASPWVTSVRCLHNPARPRADVHSGSAIVLDLDLTILYEWTLDPPLLVGRPEYRDQLQMAEFPRSVDTLVSLRVLRGSQDRCVAFGEGAGLEEVPRAAGLITIDFDDRIHHVVHGEDDVRRDASKVVANCLLSVVAAEHPAVPDGILCEEVGQSVGVIPAIAGIGVAVLELLDGLDVFQSTDATLQIRQIHSGLRDQFQWATVRLCSISRNCPVVLGRS